jgi:hypothetical protein
MTKDNKEELKLVRKLQDEAFNMQDSLDEMQDLLQEAEAGLRDEANPVSWEDGVETAAHEAEWIAKMIISMVTAWRQEVQA